MNLNILKLPRSNRFAKNRKAIRKQIIEEWPFDVNERLYDRFPVTRKPREVTYVHTYKNLPEREKERERESNKTTDY